MSVAWEARTGWPTTSLTAEPTASGAVVPVLRTLYGERLPDYRRLDLRASRRWQLCIGELELFVDVQNLLGERNVRGCDVALRGEGVNPEVVTAEKLWSGLVPSVGVRWAF